MAYGRPDWIIALLLILGHIHWQGLLTETANIASANDQRMQPQGLLEMTTVKTREQKPCLVRGSEHSFIQGEPGEALG